MDILYNNHYIRTDTNNLIIYGFSDAFHQPEPNDICIDDQGGYQFRLFPGGEENPSLRDEYGVPLYKHADGEITARSQEELEADRPEPMDPPEPSGGLTEDELEFVRGLIDGLGGL